MSDEMFFDPNQVAPDTGGGQQLPASDKSGHLVEIVSTGKADAQTGNGSYLKLGCRVIESTVANVGEEGDLKFNLWNSNEVAVRIAMAQLSAVCHATGKTSQMNIGDDGAPSLIGGRFRAVMAPQKNDPQYTELKKVLRSDGSDLSKPAGQTGPAAPQPMPGQTMPAQPQQPVQQPQPAQGNGFPPQPQQPVQTQPTANPTGAEQFPPQPQPQQPQPQQPVQQQPQPEQWPPQPGQQPAQPQQQVPPQQPMQQPAQPQQTPTGGGLPWNQS